MEELTRLLTTPAPAPQDIPFPVKDDDFVAIRGSHEEFSALLVYGHVHRLYLGIADIEWHRVQVGTVRREHLDSPVAAIRDVNPARAINADTYRPVQFSISVAAAAEGQSDSAFLVDNDDSVISTVDQVETAIDRCRDIRRQRKRLLPIVLPLLERLEGQRRDRAGISAVGHARRHNP